MSKRFDMIASLIFAFIGVFFVVASTRLSDNVIGGAVTPATFPKAFGLILVGLSLLLMFETFKQKAHAEPSEDKTYYKRFFIILAATTAYIILIEPLGFIISTFLFLVVGFQAMHRGKLMTSIAIAAAIAAVVYLVFVRLLEASIPSWPAFLS